jgi:Spy/CpxP family protein refolding chaperone
MRTTIALALFAAVVSSVPGVPRDVSAQRVDRRPARPAEQGAPPGAPLDRQFRERLAEVVRRRLNLSDAQMRQLRQVNDRVERERMGLLREERQVRMALRGEMLAGDSADQDKVAALLDDALRIQRRRLDLVEQEQRALSAFMTPLQRAQYFAIQDEVRRRLEDIRQQRQQRQQRRPGMPPPGGSARGRPPLP